MDVTEKWLSEIGGWQAMKAARELLSVGAVTDVTREGRTYRGLVGSGPRKFRATLIAGEGKNAEVKCGCPDGQRGLVCAHALAVALAALVPPVVPAEQAKFARRSPVEGQGTPAAGAERRTSRADETASDEVPLGKFHVFIATSHFEKLAGSGRPAFRGAGGNSGQCTPARAAAKAIPVFLRFEPGGDTREVPLVRWLREQGMPVQSMPLSLPLETFGCLLESLVGHHRVWAGLPRQGKAGRSPDQDLKKQNNLHILNNLCMFAHYQLQNNSQYVQLQLADGNKLLIRLGQTHWFWCADHGTLARLPDAVPAPVTELVSALTEGGPQERSLRWVVAHLEGLSQVLPPATEADLLNQLRVVPAPPRFRLRLEGDLRRVEARLTTLLPDGVTDATETAYPVPDAATPLLFYTRNRSAERDAERRLEDAGFRRHARGDFELKGEREVLRFLAGDLPRLRRDFQVVEGEGWRKATRDLAIIRPKVRPPERADATAAGTGMDWLSLEVAYEAADGFSIPRQEVLRLIRSGNRGVQGRTGRRYVLDTEGCEDLEEVMQDTESHFEAGGRLAVRARQAELLGDFVERPEVLSMHLCPPLDDKVLKAKLGALGDILRPYQLEGVRWMERHSRTQGGGVLADEMGLGKTVQTLAMLRLVLAARRSEPASIGPALVICPTSLLRNWSEEAARFTPELRTHISHAAERREQLTRLSDFDVIFTSYTLIVRDLEYYKQMQFATVVLDEASYIRNPDTATAKAVRQLRANCRFALTGTPVENSVRDLWSIFEFLLPRCLPPRDDFHERFIKPLSQADPAQARPVLERLRRLIRPNLLRRTKREVAKDLPEKIEKVLWCELSGPQREVYQRLLEEGREEIRQARRRAGQGSARMTMFTVLLRLRQVCNDLRLVGIETPPSADPESSGKWPVFEELLQESLEGGHKALIFSQFVTMLRLVRDKVESLSVPFSYLDGSSQDRAEQVATFQTDPARRLFLISLKAGGYGLNLTAADEVVLVDPWWNPAVEAQAIDRAHRIGQGKPVTAYRLVTRGTVEEKILKLQSQKRAVMDLAMEDDAAVLSGVTDEELAAMLE